MAGELERYFSCKNTSPEIIVIINCVLNAPQIFITIVGNTLVLVAVSRAPSIGSQSTIMLCSLAVWPSCQLDGATGLFRFLPNKNVCCSRGNKAIGYFARGVSHLTMTAVAVDHFIAIHYHLRYPQLMTKRRVVYLLAGLWIITVSLSSSGVLDKNAYGSLFLFL